MCLYFELSAISKEKAKRSKIYKVKNTVSCNLLPKKEKTLNPSVQCL